MSGCHILNGLLTESIVNFYIMHLDLLTINVVLPISNIVVCIYVFYVPIFFCDKLRTSSARPNCFVSCEVWRSFIVSVPGLVNSFNAEFVVFYKFFELQNFRCFVKLFCVRVQIFKFVIWDSREFQSRISVNFTLTFSQFVLIHLDIVLKS